MRMTILMRNCKNFIEWKVNYYNHKKPFVMCEKYGKVEFNICAGCEVKCQEVTAQ